MHGFVGGMIVAVMLVYALFDSDHFFGAPLVLAYSCYLVYRGARAIEYEAYE